MVYLFSCGYATEGPLTGVLMLHVNFKKYQCCMSLSPNIPLVPVKLKKWPFPMSLYHFGPHVTVVKLHVVVLNLKNGHVALLIFGVQGHNRQRAGDIFSQTRRGRCSCSARGTWERQQVHSLSWSYKYE